jgi:all-trans-retinol dehydrogenase (NAD+)
MMKDGHGHIVNIASTAGLVGMNRLVDYCASKYAAVGLTEAVQSELRVSAVKSTKDQNIFKSVRVLIFIIKLSIPV